MNYFHSVREYITPVLNKSNFVEKGELTPQEFVKAGDFLTFKCPTWKWSSGDKSKKKSYLPEDKQYLVTRCVPCNEVEEFVEDDSKLEINKDKDDWSICYMKNSEQMKKQNEIVDLTISSNDDILDDYDDHDDPSIYMENSSVHLTKTYDMYITYDNYYRTPRVWLFGYDKFRNPLSQTEMFNDVSPEHAHKTVTYEYHPHEKYMSLSIHPCKHAQTMKNLIQRSNIEIIRADQYLCLFLKFIGTIIPKIEYDYSMAM